ncbi:unnamed protein product [Diabrotica balteata]|uniref:Uncharacterized protein n=1 Tax=Diabrotica balteata TaxID=107213 RepID=A0A9N9TF18_DIABA|nr:unnamed protein product [Diabrotica balteata]
MRATQKNKSVFGKMRAAFGKMRDVFKTNIPIHLKRKAFNQCALPVLTYEAETLTLTKTSAEKLRRIQRKMERSMLGISLRNRIRNEEVYRRTGVETLLNILQGKNGDGQDMLQE